MLLKVTQMLIGILIEAMRHCRRAIVNRASGLDRKASIPIAKKNRETTYTADPRIFYSLSLLHFFRLRFSKSVAGVSSNKNRSHSGRFLFA